MRCELRENRFSSLTVRVIFPTTDLLGGSTTMALGCDMFPSSRVLRVCEALSSLAMLIVFR